MADKTSEVDQALAKLEEVKKQLMEKKQEELSPVAVGTEAPKEGETQKDQVYATIQAAMTSSGPKVFIDGNIMIAKSIADYITEYCKMAMRQHIIDNLQVKEDKKE